jgi:Family of unknown function (DUF6384)
MNEVVVKEQTSLDELMLAMDVVDTLRHKELMLAREVEADDREQRLLERLREIYTAQGITVTDDVLKQGVQALQEERFVYHGAPPSFSRSLATLYVTRGRWGKWVTAAVAALILGVLGLQFGVLAPRQHALAAVPVDLQSAYQTVVADTRDAAALADAQRLLGDGETALAQHDLGTARSSIGALQALDFKLREEYELKIVSQPGERSGVWRVPDDNRRARNYYLIVEAIAPNGRPLQMPVRNEEDGKTRRVSRWGLRVDEATFNQVAADKRDDGIIEHDVIGEKRRGMLEPEYSVATTGAAITKW